MSPCCCLPISVWFGPRDAKESRCCKLWLGLNGGKRKQGPTAGSAGGSPPRPPGPSPVQFGSEGFAEKAAARSQTCWEVGQAAGLLSPPACLCLLGGSSQSRGHGPEPGLEPARCAHPRLWAAGSRCFHRVRLSLSSTALTGPSPQVSQTPPCARGALTCRPWRSAELSPWPGGGSDAVPAVWHLLIREEFAWTAGLGQLAGCAS